MLEIRCGTEIACVIRLNFRPFRLSMCALLFFNLLEMFCFLLIIQNKHI